MVEPIAELLDRQAIENVILRYARGIDRVDRELVRSCFHDDAQLEYGIFSGTAAEVFAAKDRGAASDAGEWAQVTNHYLTNILIEIGGDQAHAETYCLAFHRTALRSDRIGFMASHEDAEIEGEPRDIIVGARYVDRFERRQGLWKIAHRVEVWDWSRIEPVGNHWLLSPDQFELGRRDRLDASYARR